MAAERVRAPQDSTLVLPLSPGRWASLTVPPGLRLTELARMMAMLDLMKDGLVRAADHPDPVGARSTTRPRRRRRQDPGLDEKLEIVAKSSETGVKAAARMFGCHPETITRWRRELGEPDGRAHNGGSHLVPDGPSGRRFDADAARARGIDAAFEEGGGQ